MRVFFTIITLLLTVSGIAQPKGENYYFHFNPAVSRQQAMLAINLNTDLTAVNIKDKPAVITLLPAEMPLQQVTPFLAVSARWKEREHLPENTMIEIRFSKDGNLWNNWQALPHDEHADDGAGKHCSGLLFEEEGPHFFQIRIITNNDKKGAVLQSLMVNFFNPGKIKAQLKKEPTAAGASGPDDPQTCPCPIPPYRSRTQWNCPQGQGLAPGVTVAASVTHLIVHHSAGSNTSANWDATVLSIWNSHVNTNGWSDIGYNWLVAPNGDLYEGRGGGNNVIGAHFCGTNGNTMGTCMLGTYTSVNVTDTARATLVKVLGWKCCNSNINPTAQSLHTSSGLNLFNISGHRDGCSTECPGNQVYATLPQIRTEVQNYVTVCAPCPPPASPVITATPTNATACNGDSVLLTASANNCTGCTYSWNTGATTASIWAKTAGTYTVFISSNCGMVSAVRAVTITPSVTPSVQFTYSGCPSNNLLFNANPTNGGASPTYQWYVNNALAGTGGTFTLNPAINGNTVYCRMTSNATCPLPATVQSPTETINCIATAVIDIEGVEYLNVSPNPAVNQLAVSIRLRQPKQVQVILRNATGALLVQLPAERISGTQTRTLDVRTLATGTYYVEVVVDKKKAVLPVVVKR